MAEVTREDKIAYLWDLGKEVHNIRPRWVNFDAMSDAELDQLADQWQAALAYVIEEEKYYDSLREEEEAVADLYGNDDHVCDPIVVAGAIYCRHCGSEF